jgi:hypothetical protein
MHVFFTGCIVSAPLVLGMDLTDEKLEPVTAPLSQNTGNHV